jgi:hypothetical protein
MNVHPALPRLQTQSTPDAAPPAPAASGSPSPLSFFATHDYADSSGPIEHPALFVREGNDADAVNRDDISQGGMQDCAFLAAVGTLTNTPEGRALLRDAIHENRNDRGEVDSYTVTLHQADRGFFGLGAPSFREIQVHVEASYPPGHSHPRVGPDGEREVWPLVLERAWAQSQGGLEQIEHDPPHAAVAMEALTGRPASHTEFWHAFDVESTIRAGLAAGHLMVLGGRPGFEFEGLVGQHAYIVTGTREFEGRVYVLLHNPWGGDVRSVAVDEITHYFHGIDVGSVP